MWTGAATAAIVMLSGCTRPEPASEAPVSAPATEQREFGRTADGGIVKLYTLKNSHGVEARIMNYGATIVSLSTPDRSGQLRDIVLGFDTFEEYAEKNTPFFGVVVGRYGNRIARGRFSLDGREYTLAVNDPPNHLHGGLRGFDKVLWTGEAFDGPDGPSVRLEYVSPDGDQGYPGRLTATVVYSLNEQNELRIAYSASTDKKTVVNLTNHTYFNLAGEGDILGHEVVIEADRFTPTDRTLIPTGVLQPVAGTPFDFTTSMTVGARIDAQDEQLRFAGGYDHNFVLRAGGAGALTRAARVRDPRSGRVLEVRTMEPGVQFYTGNFLDGTITGKQGRVYARRSGLCLETQHFPDSPNQPTFPTTTLEPGQKYETTTIFAFTTD